MKKLFDNVGMKMNEIGVKIAILQEKSKVVLLEKRGEGTVSQAITILISVVLGALLLSGLYLLFDKVVLPTLTEKIREMFDYKG